MKPAFQPPLQTRALFTLLTGLALAGLPFLFHLPIWIGILFLILLAVDALRLHNKQQPIPKLLLILAAAAGLAIILIQFHTLFGLGAGSALLLIMLGFKTLEIRTHRDAMLTLFLGYFVVITGFLFSQSLQFLPYLLVTAFVLTVALHQLNDFNGQQPLQQHLRSALLMFALAIPVMLVLFVVFPRLSSPLWALPQANQARTGISDSMAPGDISQLLQSSAPAFRVSFKNNQPPEKALRYWRGPVLSQFDGSRWSKTNYRNIKEATSLKVTGVLQQYTLTLEPHHRRWIFALDMPASTTQGTKLSAEYELLSQTPVRESRRFQLSSATQYKLDNNLDAQLLRLALELPEKSAPKTRQLATQLWAESKNAADYIQKVLAYFNQQPFSYTLQPKRLSGDHTDNFLFSTQEGFCEHYASSFVVLMRAAGIPARVVTGYLGGEWNDTAKYLLVRQSDAHAWAEVWLQEQGWVRVDPTGAIAPERINNSIMEALSDTSNLPILARFNLLNRLSLQWDTLNYYWTLWVVGYDSGRQNSLLDKLSLGLQSWGRTLITLLIGILIVALGWSLIFMLRYWSRRPDPVISSYQKLTRKLAGIGLARLPHEPPLKYAQRVIQTRPDLENTVRKIIGYYIQLRYSKESDPDQIKQLQKAVSNLKP